MKLNKRLKKKIAKQNKIEFVTKKPYKIEKNGDYSKRVNLPADILLEIGDYVFVREMDDRSIMISPVELFSKPDEVCPVCGFYKGGKQCQSATCRKKRL